MTAIFDTPLSTQRYCWVQDFISQDQSIKSVTDVGCSQGRMLIWLKHIANLELVNCVDQSLPTIEDGIESCFQPNLHEMLFGRKNSEKRLDIRVYHGDIVVPDDRLKADCFTMVEVIEHIPLDHLERVCQTVFGYYKPRFIIVTTPNSEFNHLLQAASAAKKAKLQQQILQREQEAQQMMALSQDCQNGNIEACRKGLVQPPYQQAIKVDYSNSHHNAIPSKFRHYDHKFEWNRNEFVQWADLMCKTYSYEVHIGGVGELPGSKPFGPCTQIALFKRLDSYSVEISGTVADPSLCFDLFLNKLSVQEEEPEFLGDPTLRKICLRAEFYIPGTPGFRIEGESNYSSRWDDEGNSI